MRQLVVKLISLYQATLSPDHGWRRQHHPYGFCRFYPTCSQFTKIAVERHGVVAGLWLGLKRLGRCHPWSAGGIDEVPAQ